MCNEREQVAFFLVSDHINIHIHIFIQNIDTHVHTQVQYIYTHGSDDTWSGGVCVPDEQTGLFVLRAQHEILWPTNPSTYIYTASPRWTTPIQLLMVVVLFVSLARSLSLFDVYHTRTSTGMSARDASCFFVLSPLYNEFLSRLAANRSCPPRRPHDGCDSSGDERGGHRAIFAATVS